MLPALRKVPAFSTVPASVPLDWKVPPAAMLTGAETVPETFRVPEATDSPGNETEPESSTAPGPSTARVPGPDTAPEKVAVSAGTSVVAALTYTGRFVSKACGRVMVPSVASEAVKATPDAPGSMARRPT